LYAQFPHFTIPECNFLSSSPARNIYAGVVSRLWIIFLRVQSHFFLLYSRFLPFSSSARRSHDSVKSWLRGCQLWKLCLPTYWESVGAATSVMWLLSMGVGNGRCSL
jgi:hypothetical protein